MREPKVIIGAVIVCLIAAATPPLLNLLHAVCSGTRVPFVYAYLSEIQFIATALFIILILCRSYSSSILCRFSLLVVYLMLLSVLILSTRGLIATKIEISLYSALAILTGIYVVKQLWRKPIFIEKDSDVPEEQLGRTHYYKSGIQLIRQNAALAHSHHKSAFALLSPWGNGKTHFIQHIKANLQTEAKQNIRGEYTGKFRICEVSLWESKTPDEAWINIINALYSTVTDSANQNKISELPGSLFSLVLKVGGFFSSNLKNLSTIIEIVTEASKNSIASKAAAIDKQLGEERALLILEDVDRASYEIIRDLLPLIERLKSISKLSIICSMDVEEVEKLYRSEKRIDTNTLRGYLFKVFDYTFILPEMSVAMMEKKIQATAKKKYPECRLLNMFVQEIKLRYDTPRQMERMLDEWANMERNFFLIPATIEIDKYTKEEAFVNFITKAMSICAPKSTKKLLNTTVALTEMKAMISTTFDEDGIKSTMVDSRSNSNSIFMGSCLSFFDTHQKALRYFRDAAKQKYARRINIKNWECADLIDKSQRHEITEIFALLDDYFKDAPLEHDKIVYAAQELHSYAITRFVDTQIDKDRDKYHDFLIKVTGSLPFSYLTNENINSSHFFIPYDSFEYCVGVLLKNRDKYQRLLDLLFDKMSYHNQAIACLRLHLVYDSDASEHFSQKDISPTLKLTYEERNYVSYKSIIQHYVHKFAERYCQYLMSPCPVETEVISYYIPYLCMEEKFALSLRLFNDGISSWIKRNPEKRSMVACGFLAHLFDKVHKESSLYEPQANIPEGITRNLSSIFALFKDINSFTIDEQKKIRETIQQILPKLQAELQESTDGISYARNPFASGAPEVIEYIRPALLEKDSENRPLTEYA